MTIGLQDVIIFFSKSPLDLDELNIHHEGLHMHGDGRHGVVLHHIHSVNMAVSVLWRCQVGSNPSSASSSRPRPDPARPAVPAWHAGSGPAGRHRSVGLPPPPPLRCRRCLDTIVTVLDTDTNTDTSSSPVPTRDAQAWL